MHDEAGAQQQNWSENWLSKVQNMAIARFKISRQNHLS